MSENKSISSSTNEIIPVDHQHQKRTNKAEFFGSNPKACRIILTIVTTSLVVIVACLGFYRDYPQLVTFIAGSAAGVSTLAFIVGLILALNQSNGDERSWSDMSKDHTSAQTETSNFDDEDGGGINLNDSDEKDRNKINNTPNEVTNDSLPNLVTRPLPNANTKSLSQEEKLPFKQTNTIEIINQPPSVKNGEQNANTPPLTNNTSNSNQVFLEKTKIQNKDQNKRISDDDSDDWSFLDRYSKKSQSHIVPTSSGLFDNDDEDYIIGGNNTPNEVTNHSSSNLVTPPLPNANTKSLSQEEKLPFKQTNTIEIINQPPSNNSFTTATMHSVKTEGSDGDSVGFSFFDEKEEANTSANTVKTEEGDSDSMGFSFFDDNEENKHEDVKINSDFSNFPTQTTNVISSTVSISNNAENTNPPSSNQSPTETILLEIPKGLNIPKKQFEEERRVKNDSQYNSSADNKKEETNAPIANQTTIPTLPDSPPGINPENTNQLSSTDPIDKQSVETTKPPSHSENPPPKHPENQKNSPNPSDPPPQTTNVTSSTASLPNNVENTNPSSSNQFTTETILLESPEWLQQPGKQSNTANISSAQDGVEEIFFDPLPKLESTHEKNSSPSSERKKTTPLKRIPEENRKSKSPVDENNTKNSKEPDLRSRKRRDTKKQTFSENQHIEGDSSSSSELVINDDGGGNMYVGDLPIENLSDNITDELEKDPPTNRHKKLSNSTDQLKKGHATELNRDIKARKTKSLTKTIKKAFTDTKTKFFTKKNAKKNSIDNGKKGVERSSSIDAPIHSQSSKKSQSLLTAKKKPQGEILPGNLVEHEKTNTKTGKNFSRKLKRSSSIDQIQPEEKNFADSSNIPNKSLKKTPSPSTRKKRKTTLSSTEEDPEDATNPVNNTNTPIQRDFSRKTVTRSSSLDLRSPSGKKKLSNEGSSSKSPRSQSTLKKRKTNNDFDESKISTKKKSKN